jgi:hypothetical protein
MSVFPPIAFANRPGISHTQSFGATFATRFFEILKPTRFVIYGTPSAEVKDAVAAFNPVCMTPLAGFRKHSL